MENNSQQRHIIFVPGKNPKPPAELHHALLWRCLLRGIGQAAPDIAEAVARQPGSFSHVAWNYHYYHHYKDIEEDEPWIERLLAQSGASEADLHEIHSWRNKLARVIYTIIDHFPALIRLSPDPAVRATVMETQHYFENYQGIACKIREMIKAPLRQLLADGAEVMVIGHSMGSIIAYDALWEMTHEEHYPGRIGHFLTIGSPLGLHYVQKRLQGAGEAGARRYPGNIAVWTNVVAKGDLTALDESMADDFGEMLRLGQIDMIRDVNHKVFNYFRNEQGLNVHRSYGYLVNPAVGRVIADWWRGAQTSGSGRSDA